MSNKIIIIVISSIAALALIVGGFFVFQNVTTETPVSSLAKPTSTAKPTTDPLTQLPQVESTEGPTEPVEQSTEGEAEEANKMFPDVAATEKHSKEEIQKAIRAAYLYADATVSDPELTNGTFYDTEKFDPEYYNTYYRNHFTAEGIGKILGYFGTLQDDAYDELSKREAADQLRALTGVEERYPNANFTSPDECLNDNQNCYQKPVEFSNIDYYDNPDGDGIVVAFKTTSYPNFAKDGVAGYFQRTHDFAFVMTPTDVEDNVELGFSSWAINAIYAGIEGSDWVQQ